MENQIQIDIDPDDSSKGQIIYTMNTPEQASGIFATAYYYREEGDFKGQDSQWTKTDIYKKGILQYLKATETPEFKGWKVIVYLDTLSLEAPITKNKNNPKYALHLKEWNEIARHPNVIFGVVQWAEYSVGNEGGRTIDNAIIRALRMKALCDFPEIPVFIRDADTLFENILKEREMVEDIVKWEHTLKKELENIDSTTQYQIIIASQPNYHRQWHVNPATGSKTTGCYAAVTSTLGGIDECKSGKLWKACLAYLRSNSKVVNSSGNKRTTSNIGAPTYIGKDEQLLSYIFIPMIFDKIYFYYLEYIRVEGTKVVDGELTPFAKDLLAKGITRYPSPYKDVLGEPPLPLEESVTVNRKDENTKTESTILKPEIIRMSLSKNTHEVLQTIFRYYLNTQKGGRKIKLRL
jgi:hypothetical protein